MAYQHIENLYKNQEVLMFDRCYALEKINGTSTHVTWKDGKLTFFCGGVNYDNFVALFNQDDLKQGFEELALPVVTIYGEGYGGKCQGMKNTYGSDLRFIGFEVTVGDSWLNVPSAEDIIKGLGLDFVSYCEIRTNIDVIEAEMLKPSVQAIRNGMGDDKLREGIVLRPLIELTKNNGQRIVAKHKNPKFQETKTKREIDPDKLVVLKEAKAVAEEWVTEMRLSHVLDKLPEAKDMTATRQVITAMCEDVLREGKDEFEPSKAVMKAICSRTAMMFKQRFQNQLHEEKGE